MLAQVALGIVLLLLGAMHHRYWYVIHRKRRRREGDDLRDGKVRDTTDFLLKWRITALLLMAGWLVLALSVW